MRREGIKTQTAESHDGRGWTGPRPQLVTSRTVVTLPLKLEVRKAVRPRMARKEVEKVPLLGFFV